MKIYVINLKKDNEKRQRIASMFQTLNITNYEIFDAVNGNELKQFEINKKWYDPWSHLHLTKGEVGCALSHYQLWQKIKKERKMAMILEDDFIINNEKLFVECANYEEEYTKKVCSKFEVLYLGRKKMSPETEQNFTILPSAKYKSPLLKTILEQNKIVSAKLSYWTIGYIITPMGADTLTTNYDFNKNIFPVDEYIPWIYGQNDLTYLGIPNNSTKNKSFLAIEPSIIKPKNNAFADSGTFFSPSVPVYNSECILITVATDENDCVKRYRNSCLKYGINPVILGLDDKWKGGNMAAGQGGGQKINFLKRYLQDISTNKLIIFTDSYDVICNDHINIMIETYKSKFENKLVFGAETSCWPDTNLAAKYPVVDVNNKYLNSGNFIGWSDDIKKIIELPINNSDDDQLYYTHRFFESLNHTTDIQIVLDYDNDMFFCLNGATNSYNLNKSKSCITIKENRPAFIHGNGPAEIKRELNYIGNYISGGYNSTYGYKNMNKLETLPQILIVFEEVGNPKDNIFEKLTDLDYPKDLIRFVYIYNDSINTILLNAFSKMLLIKKTDSSLIDVVSTINKENDYVFYLTSNAILENKNTLRSLVAEKKNVIAPLLTKPGFLFSNFWGDVDENNFYKRSKHYNTILNATEKSCWNVPYVWYAILIKTELFTKDMLTVNIDKGDGIDMAFCYNMRKNNRFMYVLNTEHFGYFSDCKDVDLNSFESDQIEWEKKYIDQKFIEKKNSLQEVCLDVHKIKIFTSEFCKELIDKAEAFGSWSDGGNKHYDKRLGGTENHPTQDIHMNQIGLEKMWKYIVMTYIKPIIWNKYKYSTKDINISFIVKYSMDGQKELGSHHDSSTYTVSICLNNDFEGGGCQFVRQNRSIINKDIGSVIIHPGRLTHYHKGLPITSGVRYIMISFIN